jgi:hypothetical protein
MADIGDVLATSENGFFRAACNDVLRIVSVLSLDATDVRKPRTKVSVVQNAYEKAVYLGRFFYMVFVKGFTPTVFDVLPYWFWRLLTTAIFLYRLFLLPFWLRMTGYLRYANWSDLGSKQPAKDSVEAQPLKKVDLSAQTNLSKCDFGDPDYEKFITQLYKLTTHLSPHSQCTNPFAHDSFPGNFFDHLTGVYKILVAWKQPRYVIRSGLFHSVYGTFDYRYSLYDLRQGREPLRSLIGPGAEELSFAICTSDRIGLLHRIAIKMYGHVASMSLDGSSSSLEWLYGDHSTAEDKATTASTITAADGTTYPKMIGKLGPEGFMVQNHITQQFHALSPDLFAQYGMVMLADFMEQGVIALGAPDSDLCMFRFMRFRFWADFVNYLGDYVRVPPAPFVKYFGPDKAYIEPTRDEVTRFKALWMNIMEKYHAFYHLKHRPSDAEFQYVSAAPDQDRQLALQMTQKYPYLAEPFLALGAQLCKTEKWEVSAPVVAIQVVFSFCEWCVLD